MIFNGLYLDVKPNGKKAWCYRFKLNGKSSMFALGEYPKFKLAEAREKCKHLHLDDRPELVHFPDNCRYVPKNEAPDSSTHIHMMRQGTDQRTAAFMLVERHRLTIYDTAGGALHNGRHAVLGAFNLIVNAGDGHTEGVIATAQHFTAVGLQGIAHADEFLQAHTILAPEALSISSDDDIMA